MHDQYYIGMDAVVRRSGLTDAVLVFEYQKSNDYKDFLRKCATHAHKVGDIEIRNKLERELYGWKEITDTLTTD